MVFSSWGNDGGVWSTSPSPDNTVKAENVAVSFSGRTALSMGVSVSSLGHRGTSSGFSLPASVWESWGGPGLGFWVRSRYRDDSEASGWPTGTGVGRGRPGNTGVGGSAMLMAPSPLWGTLGGDVTTSMGNESGSGGGMIRGITGSRYPLRTPVTGAVSVVTMATAGDVTKPAALPLITADSDTDGGGVVTPGGGVVTPREGVVTPRGGVVVVEVVGSGPAVVTGAEFGLLVVATVMGVAGVVLVVVRAAVVMVTGGVVTLTGLVV